MRDGLVREAADDQTEDGGQRRVTTRRGIGVAFHHMGNYHYAINSVVNNGTEVGEMANWGATVYYCSGLRASTGPHVHTEAAEVGTNFSDTWGFNPECAELSLHRLLAAVTYSAAAGDRSLAPQGDTPARNPEGSRT